MNLPGSRHQQVAGSDFFAPVTGQMPSAPPHDQTDFVIRMIVRGDGFILQTQ